MEGVFYPLVFPVPPVKCTRNPVSAAGFLDRLKPRSDERGFSLCIYYLYLTASSKASLPWLQIGQT